MYENKVMEKPYPLNLFSAIAGDVPVPEDMLGSLAYVLCSLPERNREMISLRYKDGLSYNAIGDKYGISRARVEAIVTASIKTLREPSMKKFLVYGVRGYAQEYHKREMKAKASVEINTSPFDYSEMSVYDLELSTRSKNALSVAHIKTISDLLRCGDSLRDMRNIGVTSIREMMGELKRFGVNVKKYFPRTCYECNVNGDIE